MFTRENDMKCCFIGSRLIDEWSMAQRIFYLLINEKIYEHGFNEFVMGQRGAFDRAALNACRKLRKIYSDIKIKVAMKSYHAFMKDKDGHTEAEDYLVMSIHLFMMYQMFIIRTRLYRQINK